MPIHLVSAQQLAKRLILKDGSYQLATKWEIKGDRVRYFSAERSEWEDVPNSMVDWEATNKYEKERATGVPLPEAIEFDKKLAAERAAEEAKRPQVGPGLRLPDGGGVFLLDTVENQPQLAPIEQKFIQVNPYKGRPEPKNNNVEIAGPHAEVQSHAANTILYVKLEWGENAVAAPEELASRLQLIRAQAKKDRRVLGALKLLLFGIARPEQKGSIPATLEPLAEGWLKITPLNPMASGEYILVQLPQTKKNTNLDPDATFMPDNLWDFGVNPSAPANSIVIKPDASGKTSGDEQKTEDQRKP